MSPETPLPWRELPCYFDNQCQAFEPRDAEFMVHACNAYPRLIEFVKRLHTGYFGVAVRATCLLEELGELDESKREAAKHE